MPLYEYKCEKCGGQFEVIEKFSDEPLTLHEACGGRVERLVSAPAFQFKGSGWYITDYAKNKTSPASKAEGGSGDTGKGDKKSDSKTETKSDTKSDSGSSSSTSSTPSTSSPSSSSSSSDSK